MDLGITVKDKITGFTGRTTGRAAYITGCDQYLVAPSVLADGSCPDSRWFDETRLERTDENEEPLQLEAEKPGADIEAPVK